MRAHLLHVVDIDSHTVPTTSGDLPVAANDTLYEIAGNELKAPIGVLTDGRTAGSVASTPAATAEDDAYWLGGYAGI